MIDLFFFNISSLLLSLISISRHYIKKYLILILLNLIIKNLCHVIYDDIFKVRLCDKLNEIIQANIDETNNEINNKIINIKILKYSDILIEHGETIELLEHWLSIIKPFITPT